MRIHEEWRHRKIKSLAQGHTGRKWQRLLSCLSWSVVPFSITTYPKFQLDTGSHFAAWSATRCGHVWHSGQWSNHRSDGRRWEVPLKGGHVSFSLLLKAGHHGQNPSSLTCGGEEPVPSGIYASAMPAHPRIFTYAKPGVFKSLLTWIFCPLQPKQI